VRGIRICGSAMSKPGWARHNGKWGPVKPDFWRIWHDNKDSLKKSGYEVRKNDNGQMGGPLHAYRKVWLAGI
jgi:hypothetical protein